jgi:hypothetical protein
VTNKPRKPRRSTREFVTREELANFTFDAGDMDAPETTASNVSSELPVQLGRRRHPMRDEVIIEVCWHFANCSEWSKLTQTDFAAKIQQQFKNAVSGGEIEGIIRLVRRRFSHQ